MKIDGEMSPGLCYNVCMSGSGLLELVKLYLSLKINVKPTTEAGYKTVLNILEKEPFAYLPISKVRHSVAKAFLVTRQGDK